MYKIHLFTLSLFVVSTICGMEQPTSEIPSASLMQNINTKLAEINKINDQIVANFKAIIASQDTQNDMFSATQNLDQETIQMLFDHNGNIMKLINTTKQQVTTNQNNVASLVEQLGKLIKEPLLTTSTPSIQPGDITPSSLESQYNLLAVILAQLAQRLQFNIIDKTIKLLTLQIEYHAARTYSIAHSILNTWIQRQNNIAVQLIERI